MRKSKFTTLLLALVSCCLLAFFGACDMFHTPFVPILEGEEVFVYDETGNRVDQDKVFLSISGDTYYVQENMITKGYQVIEKSIYDFGEDGKMAVGEKDGYTFTEEGKMEANEEFVDVNENTYYLVNNVVVNFDQVIEDSLYFFNEDGAMFKGELDGNVFGEDGKIVVEGDVFVTVNNNTYYIQNNVVVKGTLVLNGNFFNFGENGKMFTGEVDGNVYDEDGKLLADQMFVEVNNDTYYFENNIVITGSIILGDYIYDFGEDGKMVIGDKDGNVYGEDGKLIGSEIFVTVNNNTYYIVNNVIVKGELVINGFIYNFGANGIMITGDFEGYTYDEEGKLVGNEIFVTINNNTYYVVNNITVTGDIIINGIFYNFNEDGTMFTGVKGDYTYGEDGKLVVEGDVFVTINNNTYYIENNIVVTGSLVIGGSIYDFGEDGKMVVGDKNGYTYGEDGKLVGNEIFVTINNNTYYIVNNITVTGTIVINGYLYNFGETGEMAKGEVDGYTYGEDGKLVGNEIFVTINNNTYYVVNNITVTGDIIINGYFYNFNDNGTMFVGTKGDYTYGEDGKLVVEGDVFVTINNNTYYIQNNIVVTGTIVIDGYLYNFGETGEMAKGEVDGYTYGEDGKLVGDKIFVTINNNTYYIVNNITVTGDIIINGAFYNFNADGTMFVGTKGGYTYGENGKLVGDKIFVTINNNTYYIVNNIMVNGYIVINGGIYNFNDDGTMFTGEKDGYTFGGDGKLIGNEIFVTINNNTYYLENNVTVTGTLKVIDDKLYIFDEEGKQVTSGEYGDIEFDEDGNIVGDCVEITVGGNKYYVVNNMVVGTVTVQGVVYESDNDLNPANNAKVSGVTCTATIGEKTFTTTTDSNGAYTFTNLPATTITFSFARSGYITGTITVDCSTLTGSYTVVIDKQVSNNLTGKVVKADTDMDASNNSGLSGATLTLTRTSSTNVWEYTTTTSSSGTYTFTNLTAGVYTLTIEKEGYLTITQTVQVRYNETTVQNITLEAIPAPADPEVVEPGYASGVITDGRTGGVISGLTVYVYAGVNNTTGEELCKLTTNSSGSYTTTALAPGNYTAYVVDERTLTNENYRYAPVTIALKVLSGRTISGQNTNTSNSVGMSIDGMRIVLTWGSSPSDLDSHLLAGSNHIYYGNKSGGNCNLDVDDTSAYGPETTTISQVNKTWKYRYYIHNYSGSPYFASSNAVVKVYFGSTLAYTFNVPTNGGSGRYWNVFTYNAATGEFKIINQVSGSPLS